MGLLEEAKKRYDQQNGEVTEGLPKGTPLQQAAYSYHMGEQPPKVTKLEAAKARQMKESQAPLELRQRYTDSVLNPDSIDKKRIQEKCC